MQRPGWHGSSKGLWARSESQRDAIVLNIVSSLLDLIDRQAIWIYLACVLGIILYLRSYVLARRSRHTTIFTIEKEVAAHREGQAMSGIGVLLGIIAVLTAFRYYIGPTIDLPAISQPTPTLTLPIPTRELPTLTPTPTTPPPTATPRPTAIPQPTRAAVASPTAPAPAMQCADPNINIAAPVANATIRGKVAISGTAQHARFQFYKVEYGQGADPSTWNVINVLHYTAVANNVLEVWDTATMPNGVYWLQLTVVDQTGNFPPPCRVRVTVQN
jgi:hypothetical protein